MSIFRFLSNDLGTGTITVASPITNANNTLTLPDQTGTLIASDPAGNVIVTGSLGVGITPTSRLHVGYQLNAGPVGLTLTSATRTYTEDSISAINVIGNGTYGTVFKLQADGQVQFSPLGTERMRIDSSGRLGVGVSTINTGFIAQFNGDVGLGSPTRNQTTTAFIGVRTSNDPADNSRSSVLFGTTAGAASSDSYIAFNTNQYGISGGERVRIDPAGNVGIGTNAPGYTLDVRNSTTSAARFGPLVGGATIISTSADQGIWAGGCEWNGSAFVARSTQSSQIRTDLGLISIFTNTGLTANSTFVPTERMRINDSGAISFGSSGTAYGTSGQVLISNGNAPPSWGSSAGFNLPQNVQSSDYTTVLGDAGKQIYHPSGAPVATYTIPANSSVAYPIGTTLTFVNFSSNYIFLACGDTLYTVGTLLTGSKLISLGGWATALKTTATAWVISGTGISQALIPGNSGILTSGSSYTLPITAGTSINVLVIAGGGGGGGGSGRTFASGYTTGGGGGGAGGNAYRLGITVSPQSSVTYTIGGGGGGGGARDGIFSDGSNGLGGAGTAAYFGGQSAIANSGAFGYVSPSGSPGAGGSAASGTQYLTPAAGAAAGAGTTVGGFGARGYVINSTVGLSLSSILTYGVYGSGGAQNSGVYSISGTIYGAGGTGGGCSQSDVFNYNNIISTAGTAGAVFIWWGY